MLAHRGINHLVGEPPIESEELEFVLGATRERLEEIDAATHAYTFVGAGCPDPDSVDPNHLDASYLTETYCLMTGLNDVLKPGVEYGVQVAIWSYEYYGGIDGAAIFTW